MVETARVLIVDDENSILLLLKEALTAWGYQVSTANTATDALAVVRTQVFDAAITDIRMPDMSGLELLKQLKAHRSEEHTSELQSHSDLVCRLLLEKKKQQNNQKNINNS